MSSLSGTLQTLAGKIEKLSLRERILVLLTLLAVVILPGYSFWLEPMLVKEKQLVSRIAEGRRQLLDLEVQAAALQAAAQTDPDQENRGKLIVLQQEIETLDTRLQGVVQGLLPPREMARVLEELLTREGGLRLMRLENQPPQPLVDLSGSPLQGQGLNLYRHALMIEFEGSYLDSLQYLRALEKLPRRLIWDELQIEVVRYPRCRVRLGLQTLSLTQGWIGI